MMDWFDLWIFGIFGSVAFSLIALYLAMIRPNEKPRDPKTYPKGMQNITIRVNNTTAVDRKIVSDLCASVVANARHNGVLVRMPPSPSPSASTWEAWRQANAAGDVQGMVATIFDHDDRCYQFFENRIRDIDAGVDYYPKQERIEVAMDAHVTSFRVNGFKDEMRRAGYDLDGYEDEILKYLN